MMWRGHRYENTRLGHGEKEIKQKLRQNKIKVSYLMRWIIQLRQLSSGWKLFFVETSGFCWREKNMNTSISNFSDCVQTKQEQCKGERKPFFFFFTKNILFIKENERTLKALWAVFRRRCAESCPNLLSKPMWRKVILACYIYSKKDTVEEVPLQPNSVFSRACWRSYLTCWH